MDQPNVNIFVGDLPSEATEEQLKSVFGAYGSVASCKLLPGNGKNAMLLRFDNLDEAIWIKENLNNQVPQGLMAPIYVNYNNRTGKGKGKDSGKGWSPYDGGKGKGYGAPPSAAMAFAGGGGGGGKDWGGKDWSKGGGKGKGKFGIKGLKMGLIEAGALPGGSWNNDANAVYIKGLPVDTCDADLYHIFCSFGAIPAYGCRAMLHDDGSCKGFGFVNYIDEMSVQTACATLDGCQMPDGTILNVSQKQSKGGDMQALGGGMQGGMDNTAGMGGMQGGNDMSNMQGMNQGGMGGAPGMAGMNNMNDMSGMGGAPQY